MSSPELNAHSPVSDANSVRWLAELGSETHQLFTLFTTDPKEVSITSSEAKGSLENETVSMGASRSAVSAKRLLSALRSEHYRITKEVRLKQPTAQEETGLLSLDP